MDAVGSRLGRSSSRYGSTAVFSGPVRRWKKKWVPVSPSKSTLSNSQSQANGSGSSLFLCRWTPISSGGGGGSAPAAAEEEQQEEEEPRKRKFRYTPMLGQMTIPLQIAVFDEQSKAVAKKLNEEANRKPTFKNDEVYKMIEVENMQDSKKHHFNLGLDLEATDYEDEDTELKKANSSRFWSSG